MAGQVMSFRDQPTNGDGRPVRGPGEPVGESGSMSARDRIVTARGTLRKVSKRGQGAGLPVGAPHPPLARTAARQLVGHGPRRTVTERVRRSFPLQPSGP
ncbi:hypothetical protein ACFPM0_32445 [Pseudonocardia sulfidoxydans]|uniref:hypothetical protein n=1 Tax=Pseudonocardia sulfidoxydans TaxID=54011 RepID=UPI0036140595